MDDQRFDAITRALAKDRRALIRAAAGGLLAVLGLNAASVNAQGTCAEGETECDSGCIDLSSDPLNCGSCGNICGGGEIPWGTTWGCIDSTCEIVCADDADYCGETCTDFTWDRENCGACGNNCGDGACCSGRCVGRDEAERFCESCGRFEAFPQGCIDGEICQEGLCVAATKEDFEAAAASTYIVASWTCTEEIDPLMLGWFEPPMSMAGESTTVWELANCVKDAGITYVMRDASGDEVGRCTVDDGVCVAEVPANVVTYVGAINLPEGASEQSTSTASGGVAIIFNWAAGSYPGQEALGETWPTSGRIIFGARDEGHWSIWNHDFATGSLASLIDVPDSDQFSPALSHDGTLLAYISDEVDLINQIFIADPDGANKRQISNYAGPDNIMHVAWSSDESRIFATLVAGDGGQSIHEVPAQGGELKPFIDGWGSAAATSSDGRIAWVRQLEFGYALMLGDEANPDEAVEWQNSTFEGHSTYGSPAFTIRPDVTALAFAAGNQGERTIRFGAAGGLPTNDVPSAGTDDSNPVWSPSGRQIAYVSNRDEAWSISIIHPGAEAPFSETIELPPHDRIWYLTWGSGESDSPAAPVAPPGA